MSLLVPTARAAVDAAAFGKVVDPVIENIVNPILMLMFAVGIVVFVYGVFQIVWGGEENQKKGKMSIFGGLIGMFIMLSAWGIVRLISNTVGAF
jgi:large-conductance mechanosensitive channel